MTLHPVFKLRSIRVGTKPKHQLKRRIGMRYSDEFYVSTPAGLVDITEISVEYRLVEAGVATAEEWKGLIRRQAGFFSFDPDTRHSPFRHPGATRRVQRDN